MAQIQTYPRKSTYDGNDLFLVADKTPNAQGNITNDTKSVSLSTVVAAANQNPLSLSTTGTSGKAELIGNNLNIPNYSAASGVTTFNTLSGAVTISGGTNITLSNVSQNVEIICNIAAGDGLNLTGATLSTDLKANGGLVISSGAVTLDLSASTIAGTLAVVDGGTGITSPNTYDALVGRNNVWVGSSTFDGAIQLPVGTTAQRPSSPVAGMIRYNSEESLVEIYVSSQWKFLATV
jgi:hypothetical protein